MPYVLLRAIESGNISFWVLPSDAGVTLQVPQGGGAPTAATDNRPGGTGTEQLVVVVECELSPAERSSAAVIVSAQGVSTRWNT